MASKKTTGTQAAEEQAAEETAQTEERTENTGTESSAATPAVASPAGGSDSAEEMTVVYIGPSLPFGKLRSSMILKGTEEEINAYLGDLKESYPEIPHLLVTPEELPSALDKVGRKGTILHKYFEDVLAKSRASRKG